MPVAIAFGCLGLKPYGHYAFPGNYHGDKWIGDKNSTPTGLNPWPVTE